MTKPGLDLFPEPAPLSTPPTWEDIERLALHYPSAQNALTFVERGDLTREQALIAIAHWFATAFSRQFHRELEATRREVLDKMWAEPCGCSVATYIRRRESRLVLCEEHRAVAAVDPQVDSNTGKPSTREA